MYTCRKFDAGYIEGHKNNKRQQHEGFDDNRCEFLMNRMSRRFPFAVFPPAKKGIFDEHQCRHF